MRKRLFQSFNSKTKAYVKMKTLPSGKVKILDVKQHQDNKPFKGIKIR